MQRLSEYLDPKRRADLLVDPDWRPAAEADDGIGKRAEGLEYVKVYCSKISRYVMVGFDFEAGEPGDAEQPATHDSYDLQEVWFRGANFGPLYQDQDADALVDQLIALRQAGGRK